MNDKEETNMYKSPHDELCKLLAITEDISNETFSNEYIREKLISALKKIPVILHPNMIKIYKQIKERFPEAEE